MADDATATATAPPAAPIDVNLPTPSFFWTRWFCWVSGAVVLYLLYLSIIHNRPEFAWPLAAIFALILFLYVGGARAVDVVQLVQSSGIIRAAQATAGAVTAAANAAGALVGAVRPGASGAPPPQDDERG